MDDDKEALRPRGARAKADTDEDQTKGQGANATGDGALAGQGSPGAMRQEDNGASGTGAALPRHPDTADTADAQRIAREAMADEARRAALKVGPGTPSGQVIEGEDAFDKDEPGVLMNFPKDVTLTDDRGHQRIHFPAGANEVPERLADHWFLAASGVKRAQPRLRKRGRSRTEDC